MQGLLRLELVQLRIKQSTRFLTNARLLLFHLPLAMALLQMKVSRRARQGTSGLLPRPLILLLEQRTLIWVVWLGAVVARSGARTHSGSKHLSGVRVVTKFNGIDWKAVFCIQGVSWSACAVVRALRLGWISPRCISSVMFPSGLCV